MRAVLLGFTFWLVSAPLCAQGIITTFAGNGTAGFGGDGGPATAASFNRSVNVHVDGAGNVYVTDENNHRIRRIDPSGTVTTFAGTGAAGFSGDGGPASAAQLNAPTGVCSDASGNVYINDLRNARIRRVSPGGVISTYAGNGGNGWAGEGGPAGAATLWLPIRCAVFNNALYFVDQGAHRVARITAGGTLETLAGNGARGFSGDGGPASAAVLDNPTAIAVDYSGRIYFSDQFNQRIRRIVNGTISTFAGTGTPGFSGDGGPASAAGLNFPGGMTVDQGGALYFTDGPNQRVRRISPDGVISTVAGNGAAAFSGDGGSATLASLNGAFGVALDNLGSLYIADTINNRIRRVSGIAPPSAPEFTSAGAVNAASFRPGFTPGGLGTIFGRNVSSANGIVLVRQAPWPARLNGISVTINGVSAPMYGIATVSGQEQVSFQVPFDLTGSSVSVVLENNGLRSATVSVPLLQEQPGIILIDAAANGAFLKPDFSVIGPANPVDRDAFALLYLTGLGAVRPAVSTGAVAPSAPPFAETTDRPVVTVAGLSSEVAYSGLAPGLIGLYQINFRIPAGAPTGPQDVVVTLRGAASNTARIAIR